MIQGSSVVTIATGAPSESIKTRFNAGIAQVRTRVDIYELDGTTLYAEDVGFQSGSVSVDMTRTERRNLELTIDDQSVVYGPDEFWYNKIIKPYRGIVLENTSTWLTPLGEFFVDTIGRDRFPATLRVTCRDRAKVVAQQKFIETTTFAAGLYVTDVIEAIAVNAGVVDIVSQSSEKQLSEDASFTYGDDRWTAIQELAMSISYECYFDAFGQMILRPWVDPDTAASVHTFTTGVASNLIDYSRVTNDGFMRNDIIVVGDSDQNALVFGRATNTNNLTPTSVDNAGLRQEVIPSQFIADNGAALLLAQSILKVSALEQYDLSLQSIVVPWIEAGDAIDAYLPDAAPTDPTKFLLSSFNIPLGIESMTLEAKRVINLA